MSIIYHIIYLYLPETNRLPVIAPAKMGLFGSAENWNLGSAATREKHAFVEGMSGGL